MSKRYLITLICFSVFARLGVADREIVLDDSQKYELVREDSGNDGEWWRNAVIYQIYPSSFMDSDGDGKGDLKGITSRLEHLKDAGITATWLSPIFESPNVDQGYDISDFRSIQSDFGTMEDFKKLLKKAKEMGIKIILDFVPNHTSNQHQWFQNSESRKAGYEDYYVWVDKPKSVSLINNWQSVFGGSAWTWSEKRKQYYFHAFHELQPDLNYRNEKVVQEMKNVLTFWMDQGVDGFRCDAVPFLFETTEKKDEPVNDDKSLNHIYTQNLEETYDMIYQWRAHIDEYVKAKKTDKKIMMTEVYATIDQTMLYYGNSNGSRLGAHFPFNFNFIKQLDKGFTVDDVVHAIHNWIDNQPKKYMSNWVLGNHDNHRIGSRLGKENMDAFNMITAFLPGVMVTYNGEEIGMVDGDVKCEEGKDEQAKANNCKNFNTAGRDFERTPFQWDDSKNAGFSNASKTWLPVASNYKTVNLKAEKAASQSHYTLFKDLVQFRKNYEKKSENDNVVAAKVSANVLEILRQRDEGEYILLFNVGEKEEQATFLRSVQNYEVVVSSNNNGDLKKGTIVSGSVKLQPHESVILIQSDKSGATKSVFSLAIVSICVLFNLYF